MPAGRRSRGVAVTARVGRGSKDRQTNPTKDTERAGINRQLTLTQESVCQPAPRSCSTSCTQPTDPRRRLDSCAATAHATAHATAAARLRPWRRRAARPLELGPSARRRRCVPRGGRCVPRGRRCVLERGGTWLGLGLGLGLGSGYRPRAWRHRRRAAGRAWLGLGKGLGLGLGLGLG